VALVCFGPFAIALFIYYGPFGLTWLPQLPGSRELLSDPVPVPQEWRTETDAGASAEGADPAWQLIYARMTACEQQCGLHLGRLLQVQLALGRDQDRVQRVVWHVGTLPQLDDPQLARHSLDEAAGRGVVEALGAERLQNGRVYVADPRGDLILSYPPDVEQKELLRDLKRLLTGSSS
jgi:cytochrome oxidase Cu insertion factor (SCO1/SenC/PrrC family)